ncbi:hypothetical protein MTO96_001189 [Rhipicephalus appendiculatus]
MKLRTLDDEDTNIWKETCTEKYERRPPHLEDVTLSQFSAHYYIKRDGSYARRSVPCIIRYIGYDPAKQRDYQRETVLLNHPFRSEVANILDCDKFVTIYNDNKVLLHERMQEFCSNLDIQKTIQICEALHVTEPHQAHETSALNTGAEQAKRHAAEAELAHELRTKMMRPNNDDIFAAAKTKLSAVVKKHDNIMSAEEFRFYHAKGRHNPDLKNEFLRLQNHKLTTVTDEVVAFLNGHISGTAFSLLSLNVGRLKAHSQDLLVDPVTSSVDLLLLSETWIEAADTPIVDGFQCVSVDKRPNRQAAGVALFKRNGAQVDCCNRIIQLDSAETNAPIVADMCAGEANINGTTVLLFAVYMSPNITQERIKNYLNAKLLGYVPPAAEVASSAATGYHFAPMVVAGDFDVDISKPSGHWLIKYMDNVLKLQLVTNEKVYTTRPRLELGAETQPMRDKRTRSLRTRRPPLAAFVGPLPVGPAHLVEA